VARSGTCGTSGGKTLRGIDGDGRSDVLWRNSSTGENYLYLINGKDILADGYLRDVPDGNWGLMPSQSAPGDS
jgi:hypothetical protein